MDKTNSIFQVEYHVCRALSVEGESLGPWSLDQIAERLAVNDISVTDFLYDERQQDWVPLLECEALKAYIRQQKPKVSPPKAKSSESKSLALLPSDPSNEGSRWFVQKGTHRYGPFTYFGLIRALQDKAVYEFDFACAEGMENWVRIAEIEDFKPERIRRLTVSAAADQNNTFLRRAHPRLKFESEVIVHNDCAAWVGRSVEGSVGGSGLIVYNAALYPGQIVRIHFSATKELPAFNALAEIVNKQFIKELHSYKSPVRYAVRFLELDQSNAKQVIEYFTQQAA